jgi:immune inhibitor A
LIWHIDNKKFSNQDQGFPGQAGWPENNNHYKVAVLQADGNYDLERNSGRGDGGDVFQQDGVNSLGPGPDYPNTDGYQDGIVVVTGVTVSNIKISSGDIMVFDYRDSPYLPEDNYEVKVIIGTMGSSISDTWGDGVSCE